MPNMMSYLTTNFMVAWLLVMALSRATIAADAAKFEIKGPVVTITLKDPVEAQRRAATTNNNNAAVAVTTNGDGDVLVQPPPSISSSSSFFSTTSVTSLDATSSSSGSTIMSRPWITNLGSIRPKAYWSIQSTSQPLPNWLPSLKNIRANVAYEYHDLKRLPSRIEGVAKFSTTQGDVVLKPSIQFLGQKQQQQPQQQYGSFGATTTSSTTTTVAGRTSSRKTVLERRYNLLVEASRGLYSIAVALGPKGTGAAAGSSSSSILRCLRGSFGFHLPYQTVSHVQVSPVWDLGVSNHDSSSTSSSSSTTGGSSSSSEDGFSCRVEAVSGGAARTKALLHLEYQNPTLTVVHALDNRNTVAPCICLYSGRIVYQWDLRLGKIENNSHSFLRTRVDPVSAIDFTWTDQSSTDGGLWETNVRLPLEGTTLEALAADVRIRRQFQF